MIQQTPNYKAFVKIIEDIAYRNSSIQEVFDDFLTMTISALSFGRAEQLYIDAIKRYHPQDQPKFGQALAHLVNAYSDHITPDGGWCDILGSFFEEHNSKFGRDARGQFFTPESVCQFMAEIVAADAEADNDKVITVMEPSCGSGRNILAMDRLSPRNRWNMFYTASDIDHRCVKMCTLNMFMHGMKGVVIHMDTLRMEVWGGYRVYLPETGLGIAPIDKYQALTYLIQPREEQEEDEPEPEPEVLPKQTGTYTQSQLF
jgi:type I restriction enzyme M protein